MQPAGELMKQSQSRRLFIKKAKKPSLSIIVPTFNEGKYLGKLLGSLALQDFRDFEAIVSDAPSKDDTRAIAWRFGCKVVTPSASPAIARNRGAEAARADTLLFLDADTILPEGFLSKLVHGFWKGKYVCATVPSVPLSSGFFERAGFFLANVFYQLVQGIKPHASGWCIIIRRDIFDKIGGFDSSLSICEDFDLVQRASRHGKFVFMKKPGILVSTRRLGKEGRLFYTLKAFCGLILYTILGKRRLQAVARKLSPSEYGKF